MRERLFRGKRIDTGEWIEGSLYQDAAISIIMGQTPLNHPTPGVGWEYEVDPETVGQYTGLMDKNGTKIFEGDILTGWRKGSNSDLGYTGEMKWHQQSGSYTIMCGKYHMEIVSLAQYGDETGIYLDSFDVIGNVHDNPELIKTE